MKDVFVNTIKEGDSFDSIFLLEDVSQRESKKGTAYWILKLADKTGTIDGKVWDEDCWAEEPKPTRGDYVKVRATVGSYKGKPDVNVKKIKKIDTDIDPAFTYEDFVPVGPYDRFIMMEELEAWARGAIVHPGLRAICVELFEDSALHMAFRDCPAAVSVHQAYIGGLLEHVKHLLHVGLKLTEYYQLSQDSKDLIFAACFLHDIGKIRELKWSKGIAYTDEGNLIGHIGLGFEILDRLKAKFWTGIESALRPQEGDDWKKDIDHHTDIWNHLRHLIASHHGQLEWRAIAVPQSREAHLFHLMDMIDARMGLYNTIEQGEVDEDGFTQYNGRLGSRAWVMPQ